MTIETIRALHPVHGLSTTPGKPGISAMLRAGLLLSTSMLAANPVWAASDSPPTGQAAAAPAPVETASQQFARARLMEMARLLGKSEKFSVSMQIAYEVVQENGQKIEFGETRELAVQRPDRLRVLETTSNGDRDQVLFDGKLITTLDAEANVYAQAPQPGNIDASVIYFVRDLQMRLPLAPLLMETAADELQRRVQSIDYVVWFFRADLHPGTASGNVIDQDYGSRKETTNHGFQFPAVLPSILTDPRGYRRPRASSWCTARRHKQQRTRCQKMQQGLIEPALLATPCDRWAGDRAWHA